MTHDPNSETGDSDPRPDDGGAGADVSDAIQRLAAKVDDETWVTLGSAIGQLSAIHDPVPRPD